MTTVMLFYKNIQPISREGHKKLKFNPPSHAAFAANTHWVPLAGEEFYQAALTYPILFMGVENGEGKMSYTSVALLGLANNSNDFLDKEKSWQVDTYIPAFVRRYPFILAGAPDQQELSVCIDTESGMFNELTGVDLFNSDGSISPLMEERINFLNSFKNSMEQTSQFVDMLAKMDLLVKESVNIRNTAGQSARLEDFWVVDAKKFNKLSGDQLAKLHKRGFLGWIFSHLMSMNNLPHLLSLRVAHQRSDAKLNEDKQSPEAGKPVKH
ncbi:SapC family protein [Bartonella sp. LJL80]